MLNKYLIYLIRIGDTPKPSKHNDNQNNLFLILPEYLFLYQVQMYFINNS